MLFASLPFLFGFLPATVLGTFVAYRSLGRQAALIFLSAASLVFYGWHYPPYIVLLMATIGVNFLLARRIHARPDKWLTGIGVALNLGLLAWFKYAGFLAEMVSTILGSHIGVGTILLPLGISFFTFQQIAYLVDIHQRKAEPGKLVEYVFFVTFFPQLIAGPIVHHRELIPQLGQSNFARFLTRDVTMGALLFCIGLGKKVLLADNLRMGADTLFYAQSLGIEPTMAEAWLGMLSYTFQIYFDFSGYADMALGLGLIFGLRLPENFRSPYKSYDIIDFWRRWNITLSIFLRDYIYLPLGGNRKGPVRRYANLWIVMLLGGLWHGAGWQFIVWGALHGFYLTVNHIWRRFSPYRLPPAFSLVLTFTCVVIAWVFFRAEDFPQAFAILSAMVGVGSNTAFELAIFADVAWVAVFALSGACLAWFTPNAVQIVSRFKDWRPAAISHQALYGAVGALGAVAVFKTYASGSYAFIYFQF
ncbi:MBOAT family protein [uncultured Sulfitobacter sp.]|uniref:MBOAT family O-acyltransferase n=1 Tax=uncultured Sulfitobacter sp. TaxID=191468 RepID=UPI002611F139|nr:MBOAT family O-acyltransferase [uncultured Sulfitobacter sp.]